MRSVTSTFPTLCRQWRRARHVSQMELAEMATISQRHLSWLETGRSKPSREMVLRLAEALEIPLRERNTLLTAAGFAAQYRESDLDEPHMIPVREVLQRVLTHHEPFPAVVVDRGGVRETVHDGRTGIRAPVGNLEGFAQACASLLGDEDRRRDLSAGARTEALSRDWDTILDGVLCEYAAAVACHRDEVDRREIAGACVAGESMWSRRHSAYAPAAAGTGEE